MRAKHIVAIACAGAFLTLTPCAAAQTYTVTSVSNTDLGTIAAAANGTTVFTVDASTGVVTKKSGNGARISATTTRSLITISCNTPGNCSNDTPKITIAPTGSPTNRANSLTNFTLSVTGATATIVTQPGTGNSITATLAAIPKGLSRTIYVGLDATYSGDNSPAATGPANANFVVTVTTNSGSGATTSTGLVTATVFRTLTITNGTLLSFGRISRPLSGAGTVSLPAGAASVAVTGNGVVAIASPAPSSAILTANGEGGQALTISVPSSFTMANGASTLTVTTQAINTGAQTLTGTIGNTGSKTVTVGGSFPITSTTALGAYSGNFTVTFQYN
ncbi:DUF4402 domain-containing protein [Parablastomonas sp. CN1-191]|uniref:DUF4402 domain-containing protein n=1 Tax=Parablastomonas sp. CN1-191 TaxID=3400908 RepID=UPI003BF82238